jgi:hypothetical protein
MEDAREGKALDNTSSEEEVDKENKVSFSFSFAQFF